MNENSIKTEVSVADLMQGKKNVILLHDEKRYALNITRRGKLILTAAEDTKINTLSMSRVINK